MALKKSNVNSVVINGATVLVLPSKYPCIVATSGVPDGVPEADKTSNSTGSVTTGKSVIVTETTRIGNKTTPSSSKPNNMLLMKPRKLTPKLNVGSHTGSQQISSTKSKHYNNNNSNNEVAEGNKTSSVDSEMKKNTDFRQFLK